MKPKLLQLCPLMPPIQALLDARFETHFWPEPDGRAAFLGQWAEEIEAVVTGGHVGIETDLASRLPRLKIVAINGVGYDRIDIKAMHALGIHITNTPDVLTDDVADVAIGLMLNVLRRFPAAERHVREGKWPSGSPDLARKASGLRYGIVGLGRIGQAIAQRLAGFGGEIAYTSQTQKQVPFTYHETPQALAAVSDVLFIATAASAATQGLIDKTVLDALGPRGVLINVARGSIVDEAALVDALVAGRIWGAGLDVFRDEPNVPEALLSLENVALAPHVGSATHETREAMGQLMLDNLDAHFAGKALLTEVI